LLTGAVGGTLAFWLNKRLTHREPLQ